MSWLVTGGAGYIGAHVVRALRATGERVTAFDDLSTGEATRLPGDVPLVTGCVLDRAALDHAIERHRITGVVHLAGKKQAGESVERPLFYYRQNVTGLQVLLEAMTDAGVNQLVFSSSAAVYGTPSAALVTEDTPCLPESPYGETKLTGERLIRAVGRAEGMRTVSLRYFNVAGAAAPELGDTGVTNLVPMVFEKLDADQPPQIFGADYPTRDGTCVRDYIHISDIAAAHVAAAQRLATQPPGSDLTLNIGRGEGVSVREMIQRVSQVLNRPGLAAEVTSRRPGDPAEVVASAGRGERELNWVARYGVDDMISSAWAAWRHRH